MNPDTQPAGVAGIQHALDEIAFALAEAHGAVTMLRDTRDDLLAALTALLFCLESPVPEVKAVASLMRPAIRGAHEALARARGR